MVYIPRAVLSMFFTVSTRVLSMSVPSFREPVATPATLPVLAFMTLHSIFEMSFSSSPSGLALFPITSGNTSSIVSGIASTEPSAGVMLSGLNVFFGRTYVKLVLNALL